MIETKKFLKVIQQKSKYINAKRNKSAFKLYSNSLQNAQFLVFQNNINSPCGTMLLYLRNVFGSFTVDVNKLLMVLRTLEDDDSTSERQQQTNNDNIIYNLLPF